MRKYVVSSWQFFTVTKTIFYRNRLRSFVNHRINRLLFVNKERGERTAHAQKWQFAHLGYILLKF